MERLADLIEKRLGASDYAIFLVQEGPEHEPVLRLERQMPERPPTDADDDVGVGEGPVGLVAETGAPHREQDVLCIPMLHKGRVVGVLRFHEQDKDAFDDDQIELLQALGAQAAMAVVNADLYEATVELSVTDPLTSLMNRRAMNRRLEIEVTRAQRFRLPLAVLMIDVDHFKQYNDRMGHLLGDETLKAVARTLEGSVRRVDAVARYGGEEFCVILPRTDEVAARDVAEKLRQNMEELEVPGARNQPLGHMSVSVGFAIYPDDLPAALSAPATEVLLDTADRAVYEAKHGGRNQVVSAANALGLEKKKSLHEPDVGAVDPESEEALGGEEKAPVA
jgi:diguanylate cyclase (GGDEF)-like protein